MRENDGYNVNLYSVWTHPICLQRSTKESMSVFTFLVDQGNKSHLKVGYELLSGKLTRVGGKD